MTHIAPWAVEPTMSSSTPAQNDRTYLIVLPAAAKRLGPHEFALDGAFGAHFRDTIRRLSHRFDRFVIASPELSDAQYRNAENAFTVVDERREPMRYVPLFQLGDGPLRALRSLPTLASLARQAGFVHTHMSDDPLYPHELLTGALALAFDKPVQMVSDLDERGFAARERHAGRMRLLRYLRLRYVVEPFKYLQHRAWAQFGDLVLYKEFQQADDYGKGHPQVRHFLDPHFESSQVLTTDQEEAHLARLRDPAQPLRVLYCGRFVATKGVDLMIEMVAKAKQRGAHLTFDLMGAGPEREKLERLVAQHRLEVRWVPPVPYGEAFFEVVRGYDLLLACPLAADTARTAWDVIASGLCVLAFDTKYYGKVAELTGAVELTPVRDMDAMTDRLVQLAADKTVLVPRVKKGVAAARDNSADVWSKRRAEWIEAVLERTS